LQKNYQKSFPQVQFDSTDSLAILTHVVELIIKNMKSNIFNELREREIQKKMDYWVPLILASLSAGYMAGYLIVYFTK